MGLKRSYFVFLQIEEELAKKIDNVQGKVMHLETGHTCVLLNKELTQVLVNMIASLV